MGAPVRDVGVAGSNPVTPTNKSKAYATNSGPPDRSRHSGTPGGLRSPDELSDLQSPTAKAIQASRTNALCRRCCASPHSAAACAKATERIRAQSVMPDVQGRNGAFRYEVLRGGQAPTIAETFQNQSQQIRISSEYRRSRRTRSAPQNSCHLHSRLPCVSVPAARSAPRRG